MDGCSGRISSPIFSIQKLLQPICAVKTLFGGGREGEGGGGKVAGTQENSVTGGGKREGGKRDS